jgi:hypothetical protein
MAQTVSDWLGYARLSTSAGGLDPMVAAYLRQEHRDNQAQSCRLFAVSADVARSGEKVCRTFPQPLDELPDALTEQIPGQPNGEARLLAAGVMATLVGSDSRG